MKRLISLLTLAGLVLAIPAFAGVTWAKRPHGPPTGVRVKAGPVRAQLDLAIPAQACGCESSGENLPTPSYVFRYVDPTRHQRQLHVESGSNIRIDTGGTTALQVLVAPGIGMNVTRVSFQYAGRPPRVQVAGRGFTHDRESNYDGWWFTQHVTQSFSIKVTLTFDQCDADGQPLTRTDCIQVCALSPNN